MVAAADEKGYKPPPEFQEEEKESLVQLGSTDSTELWLIQWPINQPPDFDGQELSLELHLDGQLGSFEGSSGKVYNVVSFESQQPDATVFLSSASESKAVGKISRRVSLVHYPEPDELDKADPKNPRNMYQRSAGTSMTNSSHHFATPSQGTSLKNSRSSSGRATSSMSNRRRSSVSEVSEPSKSSKRKRVHDSIGSMDRSTQDSGRGHSGVTSTSSGHSHKGKTKKMKTEG